LPTSPVNAFRALHAGKIIYFTTTSSSIVRELFASAYWIS
jgi:hypothetical protein